MLNGISNRNFIIEIQSYEKPWGLISVVDENDQLVLVTNCLDKTVETLENNGYQNMHKSDFNYLINIYKAKPENFVKIINEFYGDKQVYPGTNICKLRESLKKLREIDMITEETSGEMVKTYIPKFAVYQRDVVSLKIPTHFTYDDEARWDYDYLIYPLTDMLNDSLTYNKDLIDKLNNNDNGIQIDINTLPKILDDNLLTCFTPNRYRLAQLNYTIVSLYTKGLIHILRNLPPSEIIESRFYDIYQNSRMAKTEKLPYMEIIWKDKETNEITFPTLVKQLTSIDFGEFDEIPYKDSTDALDTLIENTRDIDSSEPGYQIVLNGLKAIKMYKEYSLNQPTENLIGKYEELEMQRESVREEIFYMNLNLRCQIENFVDLYKNTELSFFINVTNMDFGTKSNPISLSFKKRDNILSLSNKEDLNWSSEYIF